MLFFVKFLFLWLDICGLEIPLHLFGGPGCLSSLRCWLGVNGSTFLL